MTDEPYRGAPDESLSALSEKYALTDIHPLAAPKTAYRAVKRAGDIVLSALTLAVLLGPMLLVALAIWIDDPGPVLFAQERMGRGGRSFRLYKFRTMRVDAPKERPLPKSDDPARYVTRLGRFLRRFSLDELPQLFNVLRGDMSLVGPRPLMLHEEDIHRLRAHFGVYALRPGLTGLAQVNGRDRCALGEKLRWDLRYLEHFGLAQDVRIALATVPKVLGAVDVE